MRNWEINDSEPLFLAGASKTYTSPGSKPIENGSVLIKEGKISKVFSDIQASPPNGARVLDCRGLVLTAGFQNSHVHFMANSSGMPYQDLSKMLLDQFTRFGFTTVVDTGSFLMETNALRSFIRWGRVAGPRILTAGGPIYPERGIPFYLRGSLPPERLDMMAQPSTPSGAATAVRLNVANGADLIKLFTGSLVEPNAVKPMRVEIASAAVSEAHALGKPVYTHPSNEEGIRVAMESGVDVLAHTASHGERWDRKFVESLLFRKMSLVPTLKLWFYEAARFGVSIDEEEHPCIEQLRAFSASGGRVLFGTDAGYMTDFDPTQEYTLMSKAGLSPMQILASLTTSPAELFGESQSRGRIVEGNEADIAVLEKDPAEDPTNFSKVRFTLRNGRIIHGSP